jgi:opacity protein-like surface antigen
MKITAIVLFLGACAISQAFTSAFAADPLGFYVGGAVGEGTIKFQQVAEGTALGFDEHHLAWKLDVGVRPFLPLGAEIEYFDFGHPHANLGSASADARVNGVALFAVGYLPLSVPFFDLYGKAGFAHLQSTINAEPNVFLGTACSPSHPIFGACGFSQDQSNTRFGWGLGAQVKVSAAALRIRAEYERFNSSNGDPSMFSLGVIWNFWLPMKHPDHNLAD